MQQQPNQKENPLNSQEARPNFWQALEKNQKIALIVLAVFVLFLMVAWSIQFKRSLTEPFAYKGDDSQVDTTENAAVADADLKNKDTDSDGLSDWDELNIYKTSPYLEDSDSDGIKDADEIKTGTGPNCPGEINCIQNSEGSNTTNGTSTNTIEQEYLKVLEQLQRASGEVSATSAGVDPDQLMAGNLSSAELRQALIASGMDEKTLSQISDEELHSIYRQSLEQKK